MNLQAPWYEFQNKVAALFKNDPDISVGEIRECGANEDTDYAFDIEVKKHEKYIALDRLLPSVKTYGHVTLGICLYDEEDTANTSPLDVFKTLFEGNPIVMTMETHTDPAGGQWNYVVFTPEVVQFYNDNLADYHGNWNGLAEDIAYEVFEENSRGVYFCTGDKGTDEKDWP